MTNISLGQTIDGSLSSTDTKNPKKLGSFSDDYTLSGFSNWQQVQVNMESTAMDCYLQLVNASTGEVITSNNDDGLFIPGSRGTGNSQLKFTVVPGVNYAIRATSLNANETGNYTFKTSSLGTASSLVVTTKGQAGTVDPSGKFASIGSFVKAGSSSTFSDIVLSNDNKLLGIKSEPLPNQLYKINPETGSSSVIGNFPSGVDMGALEYSPSNILYGASQSKETSNSFTRSQLYTINPQTGAASSIANFSWDATSGGDIAFDPVNNRFLFAETDDSRSSLLSVSLTGQSTKIGNIGFAVNGLSFEGSTLVGFTDNKRIIINPATGKGTFDRNITGLNDGEVIAGAGSIPSATVETPTPTTVTGQVEAEFAVNSITDQKIKPGIAKTIDSGVGAAALARLISPYLAAGIAVSTAIAQNKLSEGSDKLPYGYFPDNLGMKSRKVNLKLAPESSTQAKKTWIVIHGLNVSAKDDITYAGDFSDLGKAVAQTNPGDRVLLLDWEEAAAGGKLNKTESNIDALLRLSNYTAAKWIRPVAEWVVKNLKEEFGVDAEYASKNLNLIGHSLGSLLSNEIARVWQEEQTADKKGIDPNGKGIGVNTIFALDPPSQLNISTLSQGQPGFGYDVDGRTPVMDFISLDSGSQQIYLPNFKEVSNFSRAFVGKNSLSGNQIFAAQADESFQMSFSGDQVRADTGEEHLWVVEAFKNMIIQKNELADIGKLVNPSPILTDLKGKQKAYDNRHAGILAFNTPTIETKDLKDDKDLPKPLFLTVKNKEGGNDDDIVYGSNRDDTLIGGSSLYSGVGKDNFNGQAGDDTIYGGKDNDTLFGSQGDDFLSGDNGNDSLNGGLDNDTLIGVNQNDDLGRGFGQIDTLIGGGGADLFILGTTKTDTLYDDRIDDSTNGIRDYALIVDFGNIGGQDTIQLRGTKSQYILGNSPNGLPAGRGIYLDTNRNQQFDPKDELIAIVQQGGVGPTLGTPVSLNLDASYFKYV